MQLVPPDRVASSVDRAEIATLGAMLIDGDALDKAAAILSPSDFVAPDRAALCAGMLALRSRGSVVDPITLAYELETTGMLDLAGGKDYIGYLIDAVPTSANVEYHAGIVVEAAKSRALAALFDTSAVELRRGVTTAADLAGRMQPALTVLSAGRKGGTFDNYDDEEIGTFPPHADLVAAVLPRGGLACMYAPPEAGKTFVALHLAFCVASGIDFFGRQVEQGGVWYNVGEGAPGISMRLGALKRHHGYEGRAGIRFIFEPVNLLDVDAVSKLLATIAASDTPRPALVVFDTLHKCMPGGDENSAQDMGKVIASLERIQRTTGACALLLHHPGVSGQRERGSSSLRAGMDVMLPITGSDGEVTIALDSPEAKHKDGPRGDPIRMRLVPLDGSCVLYPARSSVQLAPAEMTAIERTALLSLHTAFPPDEGATTSAWKDASGQERVFYTARTRLLARGYVDGGGKRGIPNKTTPAGLAWITAHCTAGAR